MQKIYPFDVAKEVGRGAAGLAADDLLDMVWFREAERAGIYRKAILAGSRMSVETVKQRVWQVLSIKGRPVPSTPLHTYPQRTFPQIARTG